MLSQRNATTVSEPGEKPGKTPIRHIVFMGDSLSEQGMMNKRSLFGLFPMSTLTGLSTTSSKGRFTNGYAWTDDFSTRLGAEFVIKDLENNGAKPEDIADNIINHNTNTLHAIRDPYELTDPTQVRYKNRDFVRNYAEGGATAHNFSWEFTSDIKRFFTRKIVSNLSAMRERLLSDDHKNKITRAQKKDTLVVEWSGANDLITVNATPSYQDADNAVMARIRNAEKLIKAGYRNFVLCNLPDLALTPRFQRQNKAAQDNAHFCSVYFNETLANECKKLQAKYPYCQIDVFNVNKEFSKIYDQAKQNGFSKDLLKTPYTESKDFSLKPKGMNSNARGYMFFDDVHPTAAVHAKLADTFALKYGKQYAFSEPDTHHEHTAKFKR